MYDRFMLKVLNINSTHNGEGDKKVAISVFSNSKN